MEYKTYEKLAMDYVIEHYGNLDKVKEISGMQESEAKDYMRTQIRKYGKKDIAAIKQADSMNNTFWKIFKEKYS